MTTKGRKHEISPYSSSNDWAEQHAPTFAVRQLREELANLPEAKRSERIADVRRLLTREAAQGRPSRSALAQLAPQVYGFSLEDCSGER